ncbi:MAG: hypothetical protein HZB71_02680 [Betaproteobacteria bacterium]|nr:hypothetical protein [Betaproteobacteria bacterium]
MKQFCIFFLLVLCAIAPAGAADLRVEAMSVTLTEHWERVKPAEDADAFTLNWKGRGAVPLQALVLRQAAEVKVTDQAFYDQMREKWNSSFGGAAAIGWMEMGEIRWLACRRPSHDQAATVFHLVTVFQGRAYSLLFFSAPRLNALPAQAMELVRRTHFGDHVHRWAKLRSFALRPPPKEMAKLVKEEEVRLGKAALLMGYVVEANDKAITWTFDGFNWSSGDRARRKKTPFSVQGKLELQAPEVMAAGLSAQLTLEKGSGKGMDMARAGMRLRDFCADQASFDAALEQLGKGVTTAMSKLLSRPGGGCEVVQTDRALTLEARPGETLRKALDQAPTPHLIVPEGQVHALVLELAMLKSDRGDQLGDSLLPDVWIVTVYLPSMAKPAQL